MGISYKEKERFISGVLHRVSVKHRVLEEDKLGFLTEEDVVLSEVEEDVYKYVLLSSDAEVKGYVNLRYLGEESLTNKEIAKRLGFSEGKIYYVKKRFIEGVYGMLLRREKIEEIETKDGYIVIEN